ncbi:MAG: DUF3179 domain-containing protein [Pseudomonadota bacterium]
MLTTLGSVQGRSFNGFDLQGVLIPIDEIHHGGPDRDGIPAISEPKFVPAEDSDWLAPDARVLALELSGVAKVYPVSILNWHEIVNDQINGKSLIVTYCPLCGSGMAFSAKVESRRLNFGVSGLLYNSDVLLYDRETESLWSQLMKRAVSGPLKGKALAMLPLEHTTWARWSRLHPDTLVLSKDTGYKRRYQADPYAGYQGIAGTYFPVKQLDPRYHPKQQTLGLELEGQFKAYPLVELDKAGGEINDTLAGREVRVFYDRASHSAWAVDAKGEKIPTVTLFWFAWMAFHPESAVFVKPDHATE